MAKIDEVKEYIGFLKVLFVTLIALDTSLIAWIFKNHAIYDKISIYVIFSTVLVLTTIVCFLFIHILKNIKRLKDL
jgi:cellulose synthase/poly-beta-1,6-N-acetylglucosamine synthase-like glycosyltransferase